MEKKIVEVIWIDAWSDQAQMAISAAKDAKPMTRTNVGYVLRDDDSCLVMTFGLIGDNECDMLFTIPKQMILYQPKELKFD